MSTHQRTASLQFRLAAALVVLVLLATAATTFWAYQRALTEATEAQDSLLIGFAEIVDSRSDEFSFSQPTNVQNASGLDVIALNGTNGPKGLQGPVSDGLSTIEAGQQQQRAIVRTLSDSRRIAVLQPIAVRDDAVHETMISTVIPIVLGAPLLILAAWLVIMWGLKPLKILRREFERRDDGSLDPLPPMRIPAELAGFVQALDAHHQRAAEVLEGQRRFAAEAAHELRTPVTAVSLQAEHLISAKTIEQREHRENALRDGLARLRSLCDQLLVLSDATAPDDPLVPLEQVARVVASNLMDLELSTGADLAWEIEDAAADLVPESGMQIVLQNLVRNAVLYAGHAGPIFVRAAREADGTRVDVIDHGPGLRQPERVVDPFHREAGQDVAGTGLGLAITQRTLTRFGGTLQLSNAPGDSGAIATVFIPSARTILTD
ncbi:HAMP domain-containing sensor histidine kinase [Glutamicibacter sp. JC586]|uniref:sensor histidine kinase n=1 Tax=Glutamicibacter sp. JC586 TaxID=2590552 RepID=UPI00135CA222|nr:HAMP domain-containing sensor histidine kinase [Glutamicibacter sp. JC586]